MKSVNRIIALHKSAWAVWLIFWLCVIPELVFFGADLGLIGQSNWRPLAYEYGGFWIGLLDNWVPNYRTQPVLMFVSYAFLHGGLVHLAMNMVALISLSNPVIKKTGQRWFLFLYFASLIGGAAMFGVLSDKFQPMVGASGALFGLAGAIAAWDFAECRANHLGMGRATRLGVFLLFLNLLLWWLLAGQLAWETHMGGLLVGWTAAQIADSRRRGK